MIISFDECPLKLAISSSASSQSVKPTLKRRDSAGHGGHNPFISRCIRSDNGPEFIAHLVRDWITAVDARTAYIISGVPMESGYSESFNTRFRDELLNGETFYTLKEARVAFEQWQHHYNAVRPHNAFGWKLPAPETIAPMDRRPVMHLHSEWTTRWGLTSVQRQCGADWA
jgi:transposase InsO family protein